MREAQGDLWTWDDGNVVARVITTNGFVKEDGSAVLGRGVARQALDRFGPALAQLVGKRLLEYGNHVHAFEPKPEHGRPYWLITFPVKPERGPNGEPGWSVNAQPELIVRSGQELLAFYLGMLEQGTVVLPRPGCGNGGLEWPAVKWALGLVLDHGVLTWSSGSISYGDRFVVVHP